MFRSVAIIGTHFPTSLPRCAEDAFRALGCETHHIPFDDWRRGIRIPARGLGTLNRLLRTVSLAPLEAYLLGRLAAVRAELVLIIKCDDLHPAFYRALRLLRPRCVAAFHPDDPFNTGSVLRPGPSHRRARAQWRWCDAYFLWSDALIERLRGEGARNVHYLPFACDPALHHPVALTESEKRELGAEIAFVGNWDAERERFLAPLTGVGLAIWGEPGWRTHCRDARLRAAWRGRALYGEDMARATVASKVNLNILRRQNKGACNMRTFEIPACGAFMMHEASPALEHLFPPGRACGVFTAPEAIASEVAAYLRDDARRQAIAAAGLAAAADFTYKRWVEKLVAACARAVS